MIDPSVHKFDDSYVINGLKFQKYSQLIDAKYRVYKYFTEINGRCLYIAAAIKNVNQSEIDYEEIFGSMKITNDSQEWAQFIEA